MIRSASSFRDPIHQLYPTQSRSLVRENSQPRLVYGGSSVYDYAPQSVYTSAISQPQPGRTHTRVLYAGEASRPLYSGVERSDVVYSNAPLVDQHDYFRKIVHGSEPYRSTEPVIGLRQEGYRSTPYVRAVHYPVVNGTTNSIPFFGDAIGNTVRANTQVQSQQPRPEVNSSLNASNPFGTTA